jgi:hypothetical protein
LKKPSQKRTGGMAQGLGLEFISHTTHTKNDESKGKIQNK